VRLDLDAEVEALVEGDDAGVVLEHADAERPRELARRLRDRGLQEVVDAPHRPAARRGEVDPAGERLVLAVLAPGLRERLELARGRLAAELDEVRADRAHLGEVEAELPGARELEQRRVVERAQRDLDASARRGREALAVRQVLAVDADDL